MVLVGGLCVVRVTLPSWHGTRAYVHPNLWQLHQRMLVTFVIDVSTHMAEKGDAGRTYLEQCQLFVCLRVMEIVRTCGSH